MGGGSPVGLKALEGTGLYSEGDGKHELDRNNTIRLKFSKGPLAAVDTRLEGSKGRSQAVS